MEGATILHEARQHQAVSHDRLLTTHQPPHPTRHSTDSLAETQATANPLQAAIVYAHDCHLLMPRHDNREDNIKLSVTTDYSQLINLRI